MEWKYIEREIIYKLFAFELNIQENCVYLFTFSVLNYIFPFELIRNGEYKKCIA